MSGQNRFASTAADVATRDCRARSAVVAETHGHEDGPHRHAKHVAIQHGWQADAMERREIAAQGGLQSVERVGSAT